LASAFFSPHHPNADVTLAIAIDAPSIDITVFVSTASSDLVPDPIRLHPPVAYSRAALCPFLCLGDEVARLSPTLFSPGVLPDILL